jgi:transcriptional regulator with XRE-family HTH domain
LHDSETGITVSGMPRTNQGGKSIRLVLQWLLNREDVTDKELAEALDKARNTYSNRKYDDDFPSFEELDTIGNHFGISPTMLQIAFGLRKQEEIVLLNDDEKRLYTEQGGLIPDPPPAADNTPKTKQPKFSARQDADPL